MFMNTHSEDNEVLNNVVQLTNLILNIKKCY